MAKKKKMRWSKELKDLQEQTRQEQSRPTVVIEGLMDGVVVTDLRLKIRQVNEAALERFGYARDEAIGKHAYDFILKKDVPKAVKVLREGFKKGDVETREFTGITKDRERFPIRIGGTLLRDENNKPRRAIIVFSDITELKRLRETEVAAEQGRTAELRKAYSELEKERRRLESSYAELQESKDALVRSEKLAFTGRIAASIAHEIRNPLANVSMSIQQLKKGFGSDDPRAKHAEIVERNTERINYLITELLNCARPPKLTLRPYDIHKVLKSVLDSTKNKVRSQGIKVVKRFTHQPPKIMVDREQIGRVFLNLDLNAIEAMPRGGKLTIATEIKENFFVVRVHDTGKGIPEKDIFRIFDPFFSTKPGGVGLGLTLCYGIIAGHGGTIEVESKRRKGAIFMVSLPIKEEVIRERERERERERRSETGLS